MATTLAGMGLLTNRIVYKTEIPKHQALISHGSLQWKKTRISYKVGRTAHVRPVGSASSTPPGKISEKVSESIKKAEETCEGNTESGECAAAWDEVEELSAAASHARDKLKDSDPLETYCKDNPRDKECRTYED